MTINVTPYVKNYSDIYTNNINLRPVSAISPTSKVSSSTTKNTDVDMVEYMDPIINDGRGQFIDVYI